MILLWTYKHAQYAAFHWRRNQQRRNGTRCARNATMNISILSSVPSIGLMKGYIWEMRKDLFHKQFSKSITYRLYACVQNTCRLHFKKDFLTKNTTYRIVKRKAFCTYSKKIINGLRRWEVRVEMSLFTVQLENQEVQHSP